MILILTAERVITLNQIVLIQGVLDLYKDSNDLQHDRFAAKNYELSHGVAFMNKLSGKK